MDCDEVGSLLLLVVRGVATRFPDALDDVTIGAATGCDVEVDGRGADGGRRLAERGAFFDDDTEDNFARLTDGDAFTGVLVVDGFDVDVDVTGRRPVGVVVVVVAPDDDDALPCRLGVVVALVGRVVGVTRVLLGRATFTGDDAPEPAVARVVEDALPLTREMVILADAGRVTDERPVGVVTTFEGTPLLLVGVVTELLVVGVTVTIVGGCGCGAAIGNVTATTVATIGVGDDGARGDAATDDGDDGLE
jgi:hypothetical protein